jgi:hypothetical protein
MAMGMEKLNIHACGNNYLKIFINQGNAVAKFKTKAKNSGSPGTNQ